jgi:hypothetical protein
MKKFYWIEADYQNDSLNNIARRMAEYNTAELLMKGYDVYYTSDIPIDGSEHGSIGRIAVGPNAEQKGFRYTVLDIPIINDMFNYNLYFASNTEGRLQVPSEHKGTFDCLVSLAAGTMVETNAEDVGLINDNHFVIDISPTAIHKSMNLYKEISKEFLLVDIFNDQALQDFLKTCTGTKGFFVASNCFCYIINSLIYDVKLRLELQNRFIKILAKDKIEWYVSIVTADGVRFHCARAKDIVDRTLDKRFEVLPWITK